MALRFALEGNEANQAIVRNLERMGVEKDVGGTAEGKKAVRSATGVRLEVPKEVLDLNGYETYVDKKGQVQLKKRDGAAVDEKVLGGFNEGEDFM